MNFKLTLEYKGTNFFGWQKQEGLRTVQGEVERALKTLCGQEISVEGSGRTDRGVHALGQVASFEMDSPIPLKNLKTALNDLLPPDIRIKKAESVPQNFHARFSAKQKTYRYVVKVGGQRSALYSDEQGHYPFAVDMEKMLSASKLLLGKHNFKAFCSSGATVTSYERQIFDIKIKKRGSIYTFDISGNGFLYNMVRIIVGTLLDVGRGHLPEQNILKALESGQRKYGGITMEPNGLYLKNVQYI